MADSTLLYNYKGAAYPVDLTSQAGVTSALNTCTNHPFPTLVDICCCKITQDSSTTLRAVQSCPNELSYSLMKSALFHSRDRSIEVLISTWPGPVLSLGKLAPPLFSSIQALYDDSYLSERLHHGVKFTTCMAHTFVECLKKRARTGLKCLDLSGYPTGRAAFSSYTCTFRCAKQLNITVPSHASSLCLNVLYIPNFLCIYQNNFLQFGSRFQKV